MAILFCILLIILSLSLTTNAKEFICHETDLHSCLKRFDSPTDTDRLILKPNIQYKLTHSYKFPVGKPSIAIASESNAVVYVEGKKTQLVSLSSGVVSIENISFIGDGKNIFKEFYPFLIINNSRSINITRCKFQGVIGLALEIHSINNGDFSLLINHCTFDGTGDPFRPSQGVYVGLESTGNVYVCVTNSNFTNFKVNKSSNLSYGHRVKFRPLALEQSNSHKLNAVKTFIVSDCNFENNEAFVGGGLGLYTKQAVQSFYYVSRCNFRNNTVINSLLEPRYKEDKHSVEVIGSGGGIAGLFFSCDTCNLTISNCTLFGNRAVLGGGIKIGYYYASPNLFINIYECSFKNNTANSGSGLYIESQLVRHSIPRPAWLRNLEFSNNTATGFGAGIFVAYLPLLLKVGYIHFFDNMNTSFAVISSQIEVYADLVFKNNSGQRGGALFLSDNSQLLLNHHVSLYFENNQAAEMGGAIYADSISLDLLYRDYGYTFYNVHCFIKHYIKFDPVTPDLYTQNVTFKNNKAPKGAAIYTHTLSPCSWYSDANPYSNISKALRWKTYSYIDSSGKQPDYPKLISTAVAHFAISQDNASLYQMLDYYSKPYRYHPPVNITVQPGIPTAIYFVATDQLGSREVSIATVQADAGSKVRPCNVHGDESIFLTSSADKSSNDKNKVELSFCGEPGDEGTVLFKSLDGLTIEKSVKVILAPCPQGMFLNKTDLKCNCYNLFPAAVATYQEELSSRSHLYPWMKNNTEETFVQISCPTSYCNVTQQLIYEKYHQQCLVNVSNSSVCLDGRTGIGCTLCRDEKHSLLSGTLRCGNCNVKHTALSTIGAILLMLLMISFLFLIRASSYLNDLIELRAKLGPYARSFIFFCQGLFLLYLNVTPDSPRYFNSLYSFSQFVSKTALFFTYDQCFSLGLTSTRGIIFEEYFLYIIGFIYIILLTLFVNCVLSRFANINLNLPVLLFVLVTYSYLTYTPIAYTTLRLLSCGKLDSYNSTSGQYTTTHFIWFYDATQTCMGSNGDIAMTSLAIIILIFYVLPLPLLFIGFSLIVKQLEIRRLFSRYVFSRKNVRHDNKLIPLNHSKFQRLIEYVKNMSTVYVGCFSEPHFGFWIPITMIAHFFLLVIQTSGALLSVTIDKQAQFLAVVCFFFLYIRVSLKITKDAYVQFYESISIFCLCLACIFLIINDNLSNTNQSSGKKAFQSLVEYFPLISYILMFFFILAPPAIKYCVNRYSPATPETEEVVNDHSLVSAHCPQWEPDSDEMDEQTKPLIENDPLNEMNDYINNSTYASPLGRHINMANMSHSNTYSDHSHGTGTPEAFSDVDMRSMELSNANQADD